MRYIVLALCLFVLSSAGCALVTGGQRERERTVVETPDGKTVTHETDRRKSFTGGTADEEAMQGKLNAALGWLTDAFASDMAWSFGGWTNILAILGGAAIPGGGTLLMMLRKVKRELQGASSTVKGYRDTLNEQGRAEDVKRAEERGLQNAKVDHNTLDRTVAKHAR